MTTSPTLARLLGTCSVEAFFAHGWERAPLHVPAPEEARGRFLELFSGRALEHILQFARPKPPDLRVVARQQDLHPDKLVTPEGDLHLAQLYRAYAEGHTLIINSLHRWWEPLAALCAGLERDLGHTVLSNCYLSPAGSVALRPHYDTHDVFVLQVEGEKTWYLHDGPVDTPLLASFQPVFELDALGPPKQEVRLAAGDLLYVPRGVIHHAATATASSLHVTIGVYPTQWVDLAVEALVQLAARDVRLRRALPVRWLDRPEVGPELERALAGIAAALAADGRAADAVEGFRDRWVRRRQALTDGHFGQLDGLDAMTSAAVVAKRSPAPCRVVATKDGAMIVFAGSSVSGPAHYADAMRFVADADGPFAVAALPGLDDERQVSLARRLVRGGLLRVCDGSERAS